MSTYSGIHTIDGVKSTWLQDVGFVPVKPIEEFSRGDVLAYNWGGTGTFLSKAEASPKFWEIVVEQGGTIYNVKVKKGTLKPYYKPREPDKMVRRARATPTPPTPKPPSKTSMMKCIGGEIGRKLPADPDEIRKVFYDAFDTCISEV